MPQAANTAKRPVCAWFGGALAVPMVMAGAAAACVAAALVILAVTWLLNLLHLKPSAHDEIYGFALVADFLALWLLMAPVFDYLNIGQAKKVDVIRGFYTPGLICEYLSQFWSGRDAIQKLVDAWGQHVRKYSTDGPGHADAALVAEHDALAGKLTGEFNLIITEDFGGGLYVIPAMLLLAIGFIVLFFGFAGGISYAQHMVDPKAQPLVMPMGLRLDLVSIAAIFGAYTWVAADSITRAHQWTFHPSDLNWYALRLLIAVPLGQAIAVAVQGKTDAGAGAFLAFVISMFSLDGIQKYLTAAAARLGAAPAGSQDERPDLVIKMAGVDENAAAALRAEGISTILQLTAVDPVRVSILTGLPFEYVLSLIDSAILWTFFRDKADQLREFGLRGASGLLALVDRPGSDMETAAGKLLDARKAQQAAQQRLEAALATRDMARTAAGKQPPSLAEAEADLQRLLAEPDQAAAAGRVQAMQQIVAALRQIAQSQSEIDAATADRDAAAKDADDAAAKLRDVAQKDPFFVAVQTKLQISPLGMSEAIGRLNGDSYARFIGRLLSS